MKIRKCHAAGFSLLATNHKSCKWHAETGSNATWWSLYDINLLLHAKETEKKVDYHKMLNIIKKKIEKRQKKKKGWIFWKRKKFNGISEHNKPQDKWRKQASKDEHGDDTLQMSKKY